MDQKEEPRNYTVDAGERQTVSAAHLIRQGLDLLASDVARNWLASNYPGDMQRHREQFRHAHTHAVKALGKIAAIIDHQDHDRLTDNEGIQALGELPKLIADLVRCAAKMAETAPAPLNFASACIARAEQLAERWATIRRQ